MQPSPTGVYPCPTCGHDVIIVTMKDRNQHIKFRSTPVGHSHPNPQQPDHIPDATIMLVENTNG